eukprot:CAMPEP_0117654384 /NCGR_PEP_ID=MMETSP0804-20121206/3714_1 /TAXON_ID=1074897 /ORGANISM="Tetraselmis astigmatica, Strain CCMP880" /LENGTH=83 /DNA_ID=CAMNT_0005460659 /DNA_START=417 /DNA_END=665 /DNA_ORIENTATION=-
MTSGGPACTPPAVPPLRSPRCRDEQLHEWSGNAAPFFRLPDSAPNHSTGSNDAPLLPACPAPPGIYTPSTTEPISANTAAYTG